jgi:hypothetical protein
MFVFIYFFFLIALPDPGLMRARESEEGGYLLMSQL